MFSKFKYFLLAKLLFFPHRCKKRDEKGKQQCNLSISSIPLTKLLFLFPFHDKSGARQVGYRQNKQAVSIWQKCCRQSVSCCK